MTMLEFKTDLLKVSTQKWPLSAFWPLFLSTTGNAVQMAGASAAVYEVTWSWKPSARVVKHKYTRALGP